MCLFTNGLVPPDIINEDSSVDMAVQEGEDAALTCRATGNPTPRVTWKKEDGDYIYIRKQGNRDLMKGQLSMTKIMILFFVLAFVSLQFVAFILNKLASAVDFKAFSGTFFRYSIEFFKIIWSILLSLHAYLVDSYNGSVLRLSRLERKQMGSYLCIGKK